MVNSMALYYKTTKSYFILNLWNKSKIRLIAIKTILMIQNCILVREKNVLCDLLLKSVQLTLNLFEKNMIICAFWWTFQQQAHSGDYNKSTAGHFFILSLCTLQLIILSNLSSVSWLVEKKPQKCLKNKDGAFFDSTCNLSWSKWSIVSDIPFEHKKIIMPNLGWYIP